MAGGRIDDRRCDGGWSCRGWCPVSSDRPDMVSGSTPEELFRATLRASTPLGELTTIIVTRQGLGRVGRVWLTLDGAMKTTAVMTDSEAGQLVELLGKAISARCR